jgi:hypothetical protein
MRDVVEPRSPDGRYVGAMFGNTETGTSGYFICDRIAGAYVLTDPHPGSSMRQAARAFLSATKSNSTDGLRTTGISQ